MSIQLSTLRKREETRWFYYKPDDFTGLERVDDPNDPKIVAAFNMKYLSQRDIRKLADSGVARKAVHKQGFKALLTSEDEFRDKVSRACLMGWKMTLRGANLLGLERMVEDLDPKSEIDFNPENLEVMVRASRLGSFLYDLATDHALWYVIADMDTGETHDEDEIDKGNSEGGPSSSSGGPPAATASPVS